MGGEFSLDGGGLTPLADIHTQVADGLSQLTGAGAPSVADATRSFGNVAFSVNDALDGVSRSRLGALATTKRASDTIADLLGTADKLYAQGDQEGADKLRAAAEAVALADQTGGAAGAGSGGAGSTGSGSNGGMAGADQTGQMAGQVGQQVGQIASTMAQSVQGLAQGLTQLPQQIMQGVQGIVASATQAGTADASRIEDGAKTDGREESEDSKDRGDEQHAPREDAPAQRDQAQPGATAEQGQAPAATPPPPERPPAQTRPQQWTP